MRRQSLVICGALGIIVSGCGTQTAVRVRIDLVGFSHPTGSFTLTCYPTGGTLPFAARMCADIDRYPAAMLHPPNSNSPCIGPRLPAVTISTTVSGVTSQSVGCGRNSSVRSELYVAAAEHNPSLLTYWEQWLPCDCMPGGSP